MKTTKRVLAVLLALALGLGLFAPMAAAEEQRITTLFTKRMSPFTVLKTGDIVTFAPEAKLPEGVDAELQYQWYYGPWNTFDTPLEELYILEGETEPQYIHNSSEWAFHYLQVFNGVRMGFRTFCLKAYYTAEDGTVVADYDYTILFRRELLEMHYWWLFAVQLNIDVENSWLPEILYKVLFFPIVFPEYASIEILAGLAKLVNKLDSFFA